MKYYFDTEFIEDGHTIELVSIGMVAEDGREYYAEVEGVDFSRADDWFHRNVIPHLTGDTKYRGDIRDDILAFTSKDGLPTFIAHFADYDWVVLCQLFGRMLDLPTKPPHNWPMFCLDTKQFEYMLAVRGIVVERPKQEGAEHNALADARFVRDLWERLEQVHRRSLVLGDHLAVR